MALSAAGLPGAMMWTIVVVGLRGFKREETWFAAAIAAAVTGHLAVLTAQASALLPIWTAMRAKAPGFGENVQAI